MTWVLVCKAPQTRSTRERGRAERCAAPEKQRCKTTCFQPESTSFACHHVKAGSAGGEGFDGAAGKTGKTPIPAAPEHSGLPRHSPFASSRGARERSNIPAAAGTTARQRLGPHHVTKPSQRPQCTILPLSPARGKGGPEVMEKSCLGCCATSSLVTRKLLPSQLLPVACWPLLSRPWFCQGRLEQMVLEVPPTRRSAIP